MSDNKIFDDFPVVECNECERWWINQCDGVKGGTKKPCNSFVASRKVSIPGQIKELKDKVERLRWSLVLADIVILLHLVTYLIGS